MRIEDKLNATNIEISVKKQQQIEGELVGELIPHPGHSVFAINKETLEIELAKYEYIPIFIFGEDPKKRIIINEGFEYVCALNKKNKH